MKKKTQIEKAINTLTRALKKDPGYRISWQANIAMSFYDEHNRQKGRTSKSAVATISNAAADNFLNMLCRNQK